MIKKIAFILLFIIIGKVNYGQDPVYSQYLFNPLYLNPALAGMDNNFRLFLNKRNQWGKIPSQFNANSISFDSWQNNTNSALSMMFSNGLEGEGYLRTNNFKKTYISTNAARA